ncbi:teichoic acids export ABC transporter ATP-binding subunit TagH [Thalassobacillus pellis]|uniref:teichoic acids export ABC transporter ATP-binding subunit TagH n=1 Tax=Thalassobacillus pellis TaxID=748008 RepID=UPI00195F5D11|nr:teichoic acids export ABC transporter ATP-binding subunit TagH [Thalassobacillus pellis]MBM7551697.1 teichoic acid transport system ATP-binding protein [Thalassobacillus pellis]
MTKSVIVRNVTKKYKLFDNQKERMLDLIVPRKSYGEDFYALQNVSFDVDEGDIVGFVGVNGSGKSTLSNIIAGIVPETSGSVEVKGQAALIAVNAGLDNKLTGRENIELKLLMLGFSRKEIEALQDDIIEFAEIDKFIDQPVKSYSSGMKSRLGFAISVTVDPDILLIDEALSVGDKAFAEKSLSKMHEFKESGKTMFFVSHSIGQMKKFCEKVLWLEYGGVKEFGPAEEVLPKYEEFLNKFKKMSKAEKKKYKEEAIKKLNTSPEGIAST